MKGTGHALDTEAKETWPQDKGTALVRVVDQPSSNPSKPENYSLFSITTK